MTRFVPSLLVLSTACAAVSAQTLTLTVASPATLSAQYGASPQTTNLPIGPLVPGGSVSATATAAAGAASAELVWAVSEFPYFFDLFLNASAFVGGPGPAQAATGPIDLLLTVSNPTPAAVLFELSRDSIGPAGSALPVTRIDMGDDGFFELTEETGGQITINALIGPTPLPIRCQLDASLGTEGGMNATLRLEGRPVNTSANVLLPGCSSAGYGVTARFDGSVDYRISNLFAGAAAAVFGLESQPLFLGSAVPQPGSALLPCILLPRPDLVVFLATAQPQTLVIPPAARPIRLYSQAVEFTGPALKTTTAWQIDSF